MPRDWQDHDDPWEQAEDLGVAEVCRRMGWTRRRLTKELDRVASREAFLTRVARALSELDAPRLLHRDPARGYTKVPQEAAVREPEAVSEDYQAELSDRSRRYDHNRREKANGSRRGYSLGKRITLLERDAAERAVNITQGLRGIERVLERLERRVDRV